MSYLTIGISISIITLAIVVFFSIKKNYRKIISTKYFKEIRL